jgi:hypothetical protein
LRGEASIPFLGVLQPLAHAHSRTTSGLTLFCKAD